MIHRSPFRIFVPLALAAIACAAAPALAQLSNLDKMTLIEGLRREGMGDLLQHLVATEEKDFADPVLARQVGISVDLLEYTEKGKRAGQESDDAKAGQLRREAIAAFYRSTEARRKLLADFPTHDQRPMWQTDLAEQLIFEDLLSIHSNAAEFYELGVPTQEQREAFERIVAELITDLLDADNRFFFLIGDLPRRPDHETKWINSGLWFRFKDDYAELKTKYFLAHAALYATLLPDTNPYYAKLGQDPRIAQLQKKTPSEERARLLALAIDSLEKFVKDTADMKGIRRVSLSITARSRAGQGKLQEAMPLFDQVLSTKEGDLIQLVATIARAKAMDKAGQTKEALDLLATQVDLPPAKTNLLYRLLVIDQTHLILKAHADAMPEDKRGPAIAEAYEPYLKMLNDPQLGDAAAGLKLYVYRRWESSIPAGMSLDAVPDAVVGAIGDMARGAGKDLLDAADGEPDARKADALRAEGKAKLQRAIQVNADLLKRATPTPAVRAQAMFNQAVSMYFLKPESIQTHIDSALILTDMADQFPDQPLAESSIADAVRLLRQVFDLPESNRPAGITAQYEKAVKVLLAKYPATKAADASRFPYALDVLIPAERFPEAAEVMKQITAANSDYWGAQQMLVYGLFQVYEKAPDAEKKAAAAAVVALEGDRIIREGDPALRMAANPAAEKLVRQAVGWAKLILADLAAEQDKDVNKALAVLNNFDQEFASEPDLVRIMLGKRIILLLKADKIDDAVAEARVMMNNFPDSAAPVVNEVVISLDHQIEALRKKIGVELVARLKNEMQESLQHKAQAAVQLAKLLREWAPGHNLSKEQLLTVDLVYIKALRMSGNNKDALALVLPLRAQFPKDAQTILNEAEARFALAGNDHLIAAARLYDQLITELPAVGNKKPAIWWNAWLRRLQINDLLSQGTKEIPQRIRELRNRDPNLGGEVFKTTFDELEQKWATK